MSENLSVKVHVESDCVVLVFPRKMDNFITPWEHARELATCLLAAAESVPNPGVIDPAQAITESGAVGLNTHKDKHVCIFFQWTDRLRFSQEAARIVAYAILAKAQDCELVQKKHTKIEYNKRGEIKALHDTSNGSSRIIPGR